LIDFKAGFEDSARGAVTSLDWAIVVVDPTTASVEIAANMRTMVQQIQVDTLPATAHLENPELVSLANKFFTESKIKAVFFVLNKVPNAETEDYLRKSLLEKNINPLGVIHKDPTISVSWLKGIPVIAEVVMGDVQLTLERLLESIDGRS
jgi:CO dehydrogenase nickel-insertion accessory protein CooC1